MHQARHLHPRGALARLARQARRRSVRASLSLLLSLSLSPRTDKRNRTQAEIIIGEDSSLYEKGADGDRGKKLKKAEITLNDCLACSCVLLSPRLFGRTSLSARQTDNVLGRARRGCITSAESVLVSLQSHEEVYRVLKEQPVRPTSASSTAATLHRSS